ncbi:energy transducer TonB [Hymenobacter sp. BT664]|uniref:Energy transducer TonB n=1 Tax=Hymenobacter montanus TaxID=2771359 RepID=A0A927GKP5_9BACT|nr:energy transducer TonB [Hymenobacter montanus]MBD2769782.1 energy transducer TonB [Hymenobacter montanus]
MLLADSPFAPPPIPGPHPGTAELRAYAAGTLAPAEEHRIESHLLDCERCSDLVEGFSMTDAATTDRAVAELSSRLQARLSRAEPAATRWAVPRIAAAAALLGAVGAGIWGWEQHATTAPDIATTTTTRPQYNAREGSAPRVSLPEPVAPTPDSSAPVATAPIAPAKDSYAALSRAPSSRKAVGRERELANNVLPDVTEDAKVPAAEAAGDAPGEPLGAPALSEVTVGAARGKLAEATSAKENDERRDQKAPVTDTVVAPPPTIAANRSMAKSKASSAEIVAGGLAPARVANTPMPAAPAIAPAPVGGTLALREYLRREAGGFVPEANASRLDGNVRVRFVVGPDGKLSDLKVTRGLRADYDAEALRIVCEGPAWQPGIAGGRRAPLPMEVTVPF